MRWKSFRHAVFLCFRYHKFIYSHRCIRKSLLWFICIQTFHSRSQVFLSFACSILSTGSHAQQKNNQNSSASGCVQATSYKLLNGLTEIVNVNERPTHTHTPKPRRDEQHLFSKMVTIYNENDDTHTNWYKCLCWFAMCTPRECSFVVFPDVSWPHGWWQMTRWEMIARMSRMSSQMSVCFITTIEEIVM